MSIRTVAVYSQADLNSPHVRLADIAVPIGPPEASASYLDADKIINAARDTGAEAIHPGYGFLSENPEFAEKTRKAGFIFIGPSADVITQMGLKDAAKKKMAAAGVPVVPGYDGTDQSAAVLEAKAKETGYPVLIKARAGGGGKGMRRVDRPDDFAASLKAAVREAEASFGDGHVIIEKYIAAPRHIEVQIISDTHGNHLHLFERDCSLQRRYQKVIEEAPAPDMPDEVRQAMTQAALKAAQAIGYTGAGTVEFIADGSKGLRADSFWFMEMNTRLQVEHPVTEMITGIDLVEWQIRIASGEALPLRQQDISIRGHAVEARIYAENPAQNFLPAPGRITGLSWPRARGLRIDSGARSGDEISRYYDPMIAKMICHAADRNSAFEQLADALCHTHLTGTASNLSFLAQLCRHPLVRAATLDTQFIDRQLDGLITLPAPPPAIMLIACLASTEILGQPAAGWRQWGAGHTPCLLDDGNMVYRCIVAAHSNDSFSIEYDGSSSSLTGLRCKKQRNGQLWQAAGEHSFISATSCMAGDQLSVSDGIHKWQFRRHDYIHTEHKGNISAELKAPMTATVRQIAITAGEEVKQGQSLVILEAMKMEYNLKAERSGQIKDIAVKAGQGVNDGDILLRFETEQNNEESKND